MKQNINTYRHSEQIIPLYKGSDNDCFALYPSQLNIDNIITFDLHSELASSGYSSEESNKDTFSNIYCIWMSFFTFIINL